MPVISPRSARPSCCRRRLGLLHIEFFVSSATGATSSAAATPTTLTIATSFAIGDLDPIENGYWGNELGYGELLMRPQADGTVTPWLLKSLTNTSPTPGC